MRTLVEKVLNYVVIIDERELYQEARQIALQTGARAIDAYYIATAKHCNTVLVTNDRVMKENAEESNVKALYLVEEYPEVLSLLTP